MPSNYSGADDEVQCIGCLNIRGEVGTFYAIMAEFLGGFMFMYVYYAFMIDKRSPKNVYAPAIGFAFGLWNITFGMRYTVGINPFRYIAGCVISRSVLYSVIYLIVSCLV